MKKPQPLPVGTLDQHQLAVRLGALAHPARLSILRHLAATNCCCNKDVVSRLDLAQSTVSQHLKVLMAAGLVRVSTDRQRSLYGVDQIAVAETVAAMTELATRCCGLEALDRIGDAGTSGGNLGPASDAD